MASTRRATDGGSVMEWVDRQLSDAETRARVDAILTEMDLQQDLVALREARGLTQAQLAERLGRSQPWVAKIESGKVKNLQLQTIVMIAAALGARVKVTFEKSKASRKRNVA